MAQQHYDAGVALRNMIGSGGGSTDLTPVIDGVAALTEGQSTILTAVSNIDTAVAGFGDVSTQFTDVNAKLDAIEVITQTHSDNFTQFVAGILGA